MLRARLRLRPYPFLHAKTRNRCRDAAAEEVARSVSMTADRSRKIPRARRRETKNPRRGLRVGMTRRSCVPREGEASRKHGGLAPLSLSRLVAARPPSNDRDVGFDSVHLLNQREQAARKTSWATYLLFMPAASSICPAMAQHVARFAKCRSRAVRAVQERTLHLSPETIETLSPCAPPRLPTRFARARLAVDLAIDPRVEGIRGDEREKGPGLHPSSRTTIGHSLRARLAGVSDHGRSVRRRNLCSADISARVPTLSQEAVERTWRSLRKSV